MPDDYILKLENKAKILNMDKKIVNTELEIHKYESRRLIIKKCVQEMINRLVQLQNKASKHPENEKIVDEIEDTEKKIKEGQKILEKLNENLSRSEISLLKLKQEKNREINVGLTKYIVLLNLKYEKLQQGPSAAESDEDKQNRLVEIEREIRHLKRLIEIESNIK